jgi:hypothetical protein
MPNKWTGNDRDLVLVCQFVFAVISNNDKIFPYLPSLHSLSARNDGVVEGRRGREGGCKTKLSCPRAPS